MVDDRVGGSRDRVYGEGALPLDRLRDGEDLAGTGEIERLDARVNEDGDIARFEVGGDFGLMKLSGERVKRSRRSGVPKAPLAQKP
jgi:hypothetical protein